MLKTCSICKEAKDGSLFYPRMGRCKACHKVKTMAWAKDHPEKVKLARNKWRAKPGSKEKELKASIAWQKNHPEQFKRNNLRFQLKSLYGIFIEEFESLKEKQNGLCAICKLEPKRRLDVDHDHETGKVRELLCSNCNTIIGLAQENPDILPAVINYL